MPHESLEELRALVFGFERCTLPRSDWDHAAHLSVAAWYMLSFDEAEATARMIRGIRRYNFRTAIDSFSERSYHETITLCWLSFAADAVARANRDSSALEIVNGFVSDFAGRNGLLLEYYSAARLFSAEARNHWVEPDRKALLIGRTSARGRASTPTA